MSLNKKAFTLVELMIVMAVIGVLAMMAIFGYSRVQASARDVQRELIMKGIQGPLEKYYGDNNMSSYVSVANFCDLITVLMSPPSPYLTVAPVDPYTKSAICVGSGNPIIPGTTAQYSYEDPGASGGTCTGLPIPGGYQLRLTKESGGDKFFCSPQ